MNGPRPLKIAIVAGEESGDLLGADLVRALRRATDREVVLVGLGGRHLNALGLTSLFDAGEIALVGLGSILSDLPNLLRRIGQTARHVADAQPDCLITIDSPEFSLRVARRVREAAPSIPVVHYVCPSVWAWRPGRAKVMKAFVDRVLCVLPFEEAELHRLGGPPGTYVGHRLTREAGVIAANKTQALPRDLSSDREKILLILPGSRRSEVRALMPPFRDVANVLRGRGHRLRLLLPTVPHVAGEIASLVSRWETKPEVITDEALKWQAFGQADAALIASGTVSLELALSGVPMVGCYKLDRAASWLEPLITIWSALLPNLIADRPVVPEFFGRDVRPGKIARNLEALMADTPLRAWQRQGFVEVARRMATDRAPGEIAAHVVLRHVDASRPGAA